MNRLILLILLLSAPLSWSQDRYRFSVGGGFHSLMFWGLRSFEDVYVDQYNVYRVYNHETYTVNYGNFLSSKSYSINFSVNWFNNKSWFIEQRFKFFKGNFRDHVTLTLTEHSTDTIYFSGDVYTNSNVFEGYTSNMSLNREITGFGSSLVIFKKLNNHYKLGTGIYFTRFFANDWWYSNQNTIYNSDGYAPYYDVRSTGNYITQQLGLSLNLKLSWKFIDLYLNVGNSLITVKRREKKGYIEWADDMESTRIFPRSHNFDFRFPLTFETGMALSFDKIKKSNW